ncbi:hypothetical protein TREMEDRAFT_33545, partial [Tremella mesenterica DSM 1558]|uniref:uncharacterized protein n=1 Tax=Tremella mesenterica (strain ATCC 24925 / CBS 8224 / DSM 1558 / NBRC 9311 / NRRL Y-6157 / RJB 2259-6 / UBC 559-6) TaxID=578456 RepID=UPI0003F49CE5
SLSPECSPFKQRYDSCFNLWFEGYLQPALDSSNISRISSTPIKAEEYEMACGQAWREYQSCLKVAIKQNASLSTLLDQAREEHPLHDLVGLRGTAWDPQTPITPVE